MRGQRQGVMRRLVPGLFVLLMAACETGGLSNNPAREVPSDQQKADWFGNQDGQVEPLNPAAADMVVYELQVRSANACPLSGSLGDCAQQPVPQFEYQGEGCDILSDLQSIRKSTLDELLAFSRQPHRTNGITLQYVDEVVGANTVWLMPIFPNNHAFSLPDRCDDLGSPYAVRDYYHVAGSLAERCVRDGRDEWDDPPCWGDLELKQVIQAAHQRGMKVMLDLAFNHLGHEYLYYDYKDAVPVRERITQKANFWNFDATFEQALVWPEILDTPDELPASAAKDLRDLCGQEVTGQEAVLRWLMWREAFGHERDEMDCKRPATLENQVPGFYLAADASQPSSGIGDNFTNNWVDVKFLFNHEADQTHAWEFVRTREFAFRVINYYLAMGVDAFRLDHANGLTENEWRYIFRKAKYYQMRRKLPTPVFLSESFHNILELNRVFDVLTEGYHHDICYGTRDTPYIEQKLFDNRRDYLGNLSYVLLNLETHDEGRLLQPYTGFDIWRGAAFYALAAASRGTLMLQAGQEWGEPLNLAFRRSDYLHGRFDWEVAWDPRGDHLTDLYRDIHEARLDPANAALVWGDYLFLRSDRGEINPQLFAMVRYMKDCSNTIFTFFRLWADDVQTTYAVSDDLVGRTCLADHRRYRLVDVLTGRDVWAKENPQGRTGRHLRQYGIFVHLDPGTFFQWLRLEPL